MPVVIASLFPELTNSQGDAENAWALARVVQWHGQDSEVRIVSARDQGVDDARVIVMGHVVGSQESALAAAVADLTGWIRDRLNSGAALLAVGSAQRILSEAGFLAGRVTARADHFVGDLVVNRSGFARELWGFQNSDLTYICGDDEEALGLTVRGAGNDNGTDGVVRRIGAGLIVGTSLHGPVCVRNPELALWLLENAGVTLDDARREPEWVTALSLANSLWEKRRADLEI